MKVRQTPIKSRNNSFLTAIIFRFGLPINKLAYPRQWPLIAVLLWFLSWADLAFVGRRFEVVAR